MAKAFVATDFEVGKRVSYERNNGDKVMARVKKILGNANKVIVVPMSGPNEGTDVTKNPANLKKVRGPEPGTPRGSKAPAAESDDDTDADTGTDEDTGSKAQTSVPAGVLSLEHAEQMVSAFEQMIELLNGHISALKKKPVAAPKAGLMGGRRRAMAEDASEDDND